MGPILPVRPHGLGGDVPTTRYDRPSSLYSRPPPDRPGHDVTGRTARSAVTSRASRSAVAGWCRYCRPACMPARRSCPGRPRKGPGLRVAELGSATNFTDLAGLVATRVAGLAVDLPGFGRSEPESGSTTACNRNSRASLPWGCCGQAPARGVTTGRGPLSRVRVITVEGIATAATTPWPVGWVCDVTGRAIGRLRPVAPR